MSRKFNIKNSEGDFFQSQNYVLQALSEKKISQSAFILYCFYRSLAGFTEIKAGYRWISLNSGLSKGSISTGNKQLQEAGFIVIHDRGPNRCFEVELIPSSNLPRRQLKVVDRSEDEVRSIDEQPVQEMNTTDALGSVDEQINTINKHSNYKYNTTAAEKALKKNKNKNQYKLLIDKFTEYWCSRTEAKFYPKNDFANALNIKNPVEALKYIPVLWSLDEADKWILKSDHSLTIFAKEIESGRLQSYYPQTLHYYKDKQQEDSSNANRVSDRGDNS